MSSNLMDTEPGGENTQYESIETITKPHATQTGQFKDQGHLNQIKDQQDQENAEKGEKLAENIRYGQGISERGMGGKTTDINGRANQDGKCDPVATDNNEAFEETRRKQGYETGSGIGA